MRAVNANHQFSILNSALCIPNFVFPIHLQHLPFLAHRLPVTLVDDVECLLWTIIPFLGSRQLEIGSRHRPLFSLPQRLPHLYFFLASLSDALRIHIRRRCVAVESITTKLMPFWTWPCVIQVSYLGAAAFELLPASNSLSLDLDVESEQRALRHYHCLCSHESKWIGLRRFCLLLIVIVARDAFNPLSKHLITFPDANTSLTHTLCRFYLT